MPLVETLNDRAISDAHASGIITSATFAEMLINQRQDASDVIEAVVAALLECQKSLKGNLTDEERERLESTVAHALRIAER